MIHTGKVKKQCYYFNNNVICPFDDLGCKFIHSIDPYHSVIDKSTETENESGLEEGDNETDPDSNEETKTIETFCTSTPKKEVQCEECKNTSECIDCTVKRIIGRSGIARAIFC